MVSCWPETRLQAGLCRGGQGAMCGIAGIMFKKKATKAAVGRPLIDMLDGCQHHGPDSTGVVLYRDAIPRQLRLRCIIGEGPAAEKAVEGIKDKVAEYQARIVEE